MFTFLQLAIKAEDLGSPPRSSLKTITIALENIDDNVPVFNEVQTSETILIGFSYFYFWIYNGFRDLNFWDICQETFMHVYPCICCVRFLR